MTRMTETETRLAHKIAGRKEAEELLSLVADYNATAGVEQQTAYAEGFWSELKRVAESHLPVPPVIAGKGPMTEVEVKRFERQRVPEALKKHAGELVGDVMAYDRAYLDYIAVDTVQEFRRELNRYLRHPTIAAEFDYGHPDRDDEEI
jgi:hypothetical protein